MATAATLSWGKENDGGWTAAKGRFRAVRLSATRWTLEDTHRGTGSVLERTAGVYSTFREVRAAAQAILDKEAAREKRRR